MHCSTLDPLFPGAIAPPRDFEDITARKVKEKAGTMSNGTVCPEEHNARCHMVHA